MDQQVDTPGGELSAKVRRHESNEDVHASAGGDAPVTTRSAASMLELFQSLSEEYQLLNTDYSQVFRDSEQFEESCPGQLDELLQAAKALEKDLLQQKEALRSRLKTLQQSLSQL